MPLSHVILHLSFCAAIARLNPDATFAARVHMRDQGGRTQFDQTFTIQRGYGTEAVVEFDSTQGSRRFDVAVPKYRCSATDFLFFIPDHTRAISEKLTDSPPSPQVPTLLSGAAPQSMLYANPTFVLFDKSAAICGKPIPSQLPSDITVENDQDAYYASMYEDAPRPPGSLQIALRLQTPTHQHHYVRIPIPYPFPPLTWPASITMDVSEDMIAELATQPVDTLLCPKLWRTSAG